MKRSILFTLFALLSWAGLAAQSSLISCTPAAVVPGYNGSLTLTGSGTNFTVSTYGMNLKLTHQGSGTIYNFGNLPISSGWHPGFGQTANTATANLTMPSNAPVGAYNVELAGWGYFGQNLFTMGSGIFTVTNSIGHFSGRVVADADSNCVVGGADVGVPNRVITFMPGPYYAVTDANGNFSVDLPTGTYTLSTPEPPGLTFVCPASPFTISATVNTNGGTANNLNFFLKSNHLADLQTVITLGNHRPGFTNNHVYFTIQNNSAVAAQNVVAKLVKPSLFSWGPFFVLTPTLNGDTATYSVGTIASYGSVNVALDVTVPVGTPFLTPFTYTSSGTTTSTESNSINNGDTKSGVVIGSYDPNDKQVWTATGQNANGLVEPTDSLFRYLIRFQNTGTDTAFNIIIRDTLDADLNPSTLSIVASSHPMTLQYSDSSGQRLRFVFNNIMLQDSFHNEPASHGWVEYKIRKKNGLPTGTEIKNRASIYFDFNVPVLTNWVNSKICPSLGTSFTSNSNYLNVAFNAPTTGGAVGWTWNFGDGQTGNGNILSHTYAAGGTYNVCVTIINACGRTRQICQTVTVTCAPINANFSNGSTSNLTVNFTDGSTGQHSVTQWQFGDGTTSTQSNPVHTFPAPGVYTVCLIIGNSCAVSDTMCATLGVGCAAPVPAFSSSVQQNNASFTDQSVGINLSYHWDFGDGNISNLQNPTHQYNSTGNFIVCLTVTDACNAIVATCDTVTVSCLLPQSAFNHNVNVNLVSFFDQSQHTPTAWAWDFGDGGTATVQNPTHVYAASATTYNVCLITTNSCGMDTLCMDVTTGTVGIGGNVALDVHLTPNPAGDHVRLSVAGAVDELGECVVIDPLGRVVQHWSTNALRGLYEKDLDLSQFANGIYMVRVQSASASKTLPLVVQH